MSNTKQLKGVVLPRNDTAKNWSKALNFIPGDGELIVYKKDSIEDINRGHYLDDEGNVLNEVLINDAYYPIEPSEVVRFKFGNGLDNVNVLPFATTEVDLTDYATIEYVQTELDDALQNVEAEFDNKRQGFVNIITPENAKRFIANDAVSNEDSFSVKLRKTYNLCNFDNGIIPNIDNRAHTNLLSFDDYTSVTIDNGYKAWCHVYNSKGSRVGNNGYWVTGPYTLPISDLKTISSEATHFRMAIGRTDEGDITSYAPLTLIINYRTTNSTIHSDSSMMPTLVQGTIDKGAVNANVKTRLHIKNMLPLADYLSGTIASGYKVWYHFYDKDQKYLGGSGSWITGSNTTRTSLGSSLYSNAVYFNAVIGKTDDTNITPSTVPADVFILDTTFKIPSITNGTIDKSIVEQAVNSVSGRTDVTAVNNGDGTFTLNGTVANTALTMQIYLNTLAPAITTGATTYTVSIMTKSNGLSDYVPLNYLAYNASGGALSVNDGTLNFSVTNVNDVPGMIVYSAPVGTTFDNTTVYAMLETGDIVHDWEECQVSSLSNIKVSIEDSVTINSFSTDSNGIVSGKCKGPYIGIYCPNGTRISECSYVVNTKAYIGYVKSQADSAYDLAESKADSLLDLGVNATATELNQLAGSTITTDDLDKLHSVTATAAELNYTDGVTSNIQTQLNNRVTLNTSQTISGTKTFSSSVYFNNGTGISFKDTSGKNNMLVQLSGSNNIWYSYTPYNDASGPIVYYAGNEVHVNSKNDMHFDDANGVYRVHTTGGTFQVFLNGTTEQFCGHTSGTSFFGGIETKNAHITANYSAGLYTIANSVDLVNYSGSDYTGQFRPNADGTVMCGSPSYSWYRVYAENTSISSSDARMKENIIPLGLSEVHTMSLDDSEPVDIHSELFDRLLPVQYNFIKGNKRICFGLIAQDVIAALKEIGFEENELDLVHHDIETDFVKDEETGEMVEKEIETYGIAYENLSALLIHEVQKLKSQTKTLQAELAELREKI